jgi:hypothetical protein
MHIGGGAVFMLLPRGFAPRTPLHALSRAAAPARSVRVARFASLARFFDRAAGHEIASRFKTRSSGPIG